VTINAQYPSSWWGAGFSDEVRTGEVLPLKLLERHLVLWRGEDGVLRCQSAFCPHLGAHIGYGGAVAGNSVSCPFHGYRYDGTGRLCGRIGESDAGSRRLRLDSYEVREHFGTIFVWNGNGPPDHEFPLDTFLPDGVKSKHDVTVFRCAFHLPFPAKHFIENVGDANHFGALHRVGTWGDVDLIDESTWLIKQRLQVYEPVPLFSMRYLRELWKLGQLGNPPIATENAMTITTWGGGLHLVEVDSFDSSGGRQSALGRLLELAGAVRAITCWTPIGANSHLHNVTFVLPKLRTPLPSWALDPVMNRIFAGRDWGAALQDASVMINRQEPVNPAYGKLDRGLIRFRRFWDSRIEDRSLWEGDGIHSNGLRGGIRWANAPSDSRRTNEVAS
jgi:nitrite reductase/ring-hydroxylating ferredoxin subunit